jgi:hypothetical protein
MTTEVHSPVLNSGPGGEQEVARKDMIVDCELDNRFTSPLNLTDFDKPTVYF